jgi:hypothetical protein
MPITPEQRQRQQRFESLISLVSPALDLLLATGERASRILQPRSDDYYPIRPAAEAFELNESRSRGHQAPTD